MKLQSKVLLILSGIWLVIGVCIFADAKYILKRGYLDLEAKLALKDMHRVQKAWDNSFLALESQSISFSQWDDAYAFMRAKNEKFIQSNFVPATFNSTNINFYMYFDEAGKLYYGKSYDLKNKQFVPIPEDLLAYLDINSFIVRPNMSVTHYTGIIHLANNYAVIATSPVLTSDGMGPIRGSILMGYYLNQNHIQSLSDAVDLKIELVPFPIQKTGSDINLKAYAQLLAGEQFVFLTKNAETSYVFKFIRDMDGNPVGMLKVEIPRDVYSEGIFTITHYIFILLAITILILAVTAYLLNKLLINRIINVSDKVIDINSHGKFKQRIQDNGRDEIHHMTIAINEMLELIEMSQEQLRYRISIRTRELEKLSKYNKNLFDELGEQKTIEVKLREDEKILKQLAYYDHLTGLPNRYLFTALLQQAMFNAERNQSKIAILFIDIDNFKKINDTYGHDFGDQFIKQSAQVLHNAINEADVASRLSGDEFVVFLTDIHSDATINETATRILNTLSKAISIDKISLSPTYSIGISIYPDDAKIIKQLFRQADLAMYHAKHQNGNIYCYFKDLEKATE